VASDSGAGAVGENEVGEREAPADGRELGAPVVPGSGIVGTFDGPTRTGNFPEPSERNGHTPARVDDPNSLDHS
jgi:hypothetical protein